MNLRRFNFMSSVVMFLMIAAPVYAGLAPLNPDFINWKKEQAKARSSVSASSSSEQFNRYGYIPSPVDMSHLSYNLPVIAAEDDYDLPVSYDLRKFGRVTPIRFQNPWGTCWAFGALASVESNYLTRSLKGELDGSLGDSETLDLSELHMAWFCNNNPDKSRLFRPRPFAVENIDGGASNMSLAYLSRLDGPVTESSMPYFSYEAIQNAWGFDMDSWHALLKAGLPTYDQLSVLEELHKNSILPKKNYTADHYGKNVLRLTDAYYAPLSPLVSFTERDDLGDELNNRSLLNVQNAKYAKRLIMEYGAIGISYHADDTRLTASNDAYYNGVNDVNHAVSIIGWDDNYSRTNFKGAAVPDIDGAWLVRNNWSANFGNGGYFWMSYQQAIQSGLAYVVEAPSENMKVYTHSPLGFCDSFGYKDHSIYMANVFKVKSDGESLESFSFYTADNNTSCEWQIFYDLPNKPVNGPYVAGAVSISGSGTYPYAGYHTVKLSSRQPLTKGHYFTVVVKLTNAYTEFPAAVEMKVITATNHAVAHDYESWFSPDGITWQDGASMEGYSSQNSKVLQAIPMNACINAYTVDSIPNDAELADDADTILGVAVRDNPFPSFDSDLSTINGQLPDEPISERLIGVFRITEQGRIPFSEGTNVTYYLVNRTQEHEGIVVYSPEDTRFPKGLTLSDSDYMPLFEHGYEPNEYWRTSDKLELPVYGPFVTSVHEDAISLDVDELVYENPDDEENVYGKIPKGYYELVCIFDDNGTDVTGNLSIRLSATTTEDTEDTTPEDEEPAHEVIPIGNSSSGTCNGGTGFAGLIVLLPFMISLRRRKKVY